MDFRHLQKIGLDACFLVGREAEAAPISLFRSLVGETFIHKPCTNGSLPSALTASLVSSPLLPLEFDNLSRTKSSSQGDDAGKCKFRLATWNILAPVYALHRSFPDVEPSWLNAEVRRARIGTVIDELNADILCIQEAQETWWLGPKLNKLGLEMAFAQRDQRCDGCAIAWRKQLFTLVGELVVSFDDELHRVAPPTSVVSRFARKNVALVVELAAASATDCPVRLLVATTHLYWGPLHEDVRAWQLKVLLERIGERFGSGIPLALVGDFNLLPGSASHTFLRCGAVEFPRHFRRVERFLFDRDIAKAARPMRLLGLDCAIETEAEREERRKREMVSVKDGTALPIFLRTMQEGRVLVSASKRLVGRSDCPAAYFLDARQCEQSLADMCRDLAVEIKPERFFTQCVKCNGSVKCLGAADSSAYVTSRAIEWHAPQGVDIYECSSCKQIYWFSPNISSASGRAQQQVDRLVNLVQRCEAGARHEDAQRVGSASDNFLRDGGGGLTHDLGLRSVYADLEDNIITSEDPLVATGARRSRAVTNSKYGFHGLIDYMWLSPDLQSGSRRRLRPLFEASLLRAGNVRGDVLPSLVGSAWPSDHWPLAVDLEIELPT